jgi:small subunit ribosomal protein S13
MVRILGVNLLNKKKIYVALTAIYGIGITRSKKILKDLNIDENKKVSELNDNDISSLRDLLESDIYKLEGDLRRLISQNIKRLIEINSYRGRRHTKGLPLRGQRTRTNNRTVRKKNSFLSKKTS